MITDVIAHRGASRRARENTVEAFRLAVELGADGIELDARRTSDDVIIVHHDVHLPDGRVIVELPHRELPEYVPTLAAALEACAGAWVNIEIKNAPGEADFDPADRVAAAVLEELARRGTEAGPWILSSFRLETVDRCRSLGPEVPTAWLVEAVDDATPQIAADHGHAALHPWHGLVDAQAIDRCHALALAVNVWTCDDTARAAELAGWGVDGIVTNTPDVIRSALWG